jgi:hypothetical protein
MNWVSSMYSSFIHLFIWYQCYSDVHVSFYINIVNICCQFQSCVPISSKWFTITHVVNFIQGMRFKHMVQFHPCQNSSKSDKFNHMAQFHSCDQVHPNVSSMYSKFSWISSISLNFYFTHNTILTSMSYMWENPISCQIYPISII